MASSEERLRILRMIQEGKISAEEGLKLLGTLVQADVARPAAAPESTQAPTREAKFFRVRVTDTDTARVRVNIRMPVSVITAGLKLGARFSPQIEGMNMQQLVDAIRAGEMGQIIDVYDDKDGEHVEVFLE
jgi:hypothetical protein